MQNVQFEKEKHQNCSCFPQHAVQNLSLSASSNSLWPKTRGIIRFTFRILFIYSTIGLKPAVLSRRFTFTQPLWSNVIFATSYVNVTILLVCVKMRILYVWKYVRELRSFVSVVRLSLMKLVQNILCRWILPWRSKC